MTQSLKKLKEKVASLNHTIEEKGDGLVQQCLSTPHFLCFQVRFRGETLYFYMGRGITHQGFDFSRVKPSSEYRIQDRFLQFARKYWRGLRITSIAVAEDDRVLEMKLGFKGGEGTLWFFWRGRDLFFSHLIHAGPKVDFFKSWIGKCQIDGARAKDVEVKEVFAGLGFGEGKDKQRQGDLNIAEYFNALNIKALKSKKSEQQSIKKKGLKEKISQDLKRFEVLPYLELQTKKDLTEVHKIGEGRFAVSFKGIEGHYKKREHLFNKIKKWKKSQSFLKARLDAIEGKRDEKMVSGNKPELGKVIQPIWKEVKAQQLITKKTSCIEFLYKDKKCFLGRTALENDYIRKEKAGKDDVWVHLENYKSGHLIVKAQQSELLPDDFAILASALVELNSIELNEIPIIYTKVRFLKGVKGSPGMVNYKKEKHITVYFDREWRQKLTGIDVTSDG